MIGVKKLTDLKKFEYPFPAKVKKLFSEIYYNNYAIFIISKIDDEKILKKRCEELEYMVAGYFQDKFGFLKDNFTNDYVIREVYLLLIVDFEVEVKLRKDIEKDLFVCKKYVILYEKNKTMKEHLIDFALYRSLTDLRENDNFVKETEIKKETLIFRQDAKLITFLGQDKVLFLNPKDIASMWYTWFCDK